MFEFPIAGSWTNVRNQCHRDLIAAIRNLVPPSTVVRAPMRFSPIFRYFGAGEARLRRTFLFFLVVASFQSVTFGWVYPEHREIALLAIQKLDSHQKGVLDRLWAVARAGHESRLSLTPADLTSSERPRTIDYAAWPAIAADHSCSAAEMLRTILESDWILEVAAVSAQLKSDLFKSGVKRQDRTNALRRSDLNLLRVDPEYASRAGANNVHFLLARPYTETDEKSFVETCLGTGCELNAMGVYAWYHLSALQKAYRLSQGGLTAEETSSLALAALADEGFALHFLEDVFAAGHVAGTRGDASQRKGTHDYYNEKGLEVHTWEGKSMVLKGDAWMREEDAERASAVVRASLQQFLEISEGKVTSTSFRSRGGFLRSADTLNTCALEVMPDRDLESGIGPLLGEIIKATPLPGLGEGDGELPRFRSELGPFIGIAPAARASLMLGGFGNSQTSSGMMGGLDIGVRLGLGLAGVLSESGDGLVFLDLGFRLDAASSISIYEDEIIKEFGQIFSAIPSRSAFTGRLRVPFWLIPLDLLLTAPFLLPTTPETYAGMAVIAGNGGLIPWQSGIATSVGRFQLVLGREVGVSLYGYLRSPDRVLLPVGDPAEGNAALVDFRSVQLEFPVLEYRPFRSFSLDQTSSVVVQIYGSIDIPTSVSIVAPLDSPDPGLRSVWQVGARISFDWRYYW
jgi:hypothetical protein